MTVSSALLGALARLPRPETRRVLVDRDLPIAIPDGAVLLADRWHADTGDADLAPILVVRTPYGRSDMIARLCAERGFQVVMVRCRGTFGSGGAWEPFMNERDDGRAVLSWLEEQRWFSGSVGLIGGSYLGLTQWAVANDLPAFVRAMAPGVTTANFRDLFYPGGSFSLESALVWIYGLAHQEQKPVPRALSIVRLKGRMARGYAAVPLGDADIAALDHHVQPFQQWLEHDEPGDPWWAPIDFRRDVSRVPPTSLVAGWYDVFLPHQLEDLGVLKAAGRDVRVTVGPWSHSSPGGGVAVLRDSLEWMDQHLRGRPPRRAPAPARVYVMGARRWVELPEWPPPATPTRWYLQPGGGLSASVPPASPPDAYLYDPADPTPGVGGASLRAGNSGAKDNRALEARADVLTYSGPVLDDDLTVIGPVTAELHVRSSLEHTDFFVRLCDVAPSGRSTNLTDGILRIRPGDAERQPDGTFAVTIALFATAATFQRGHRVRLQVSSGAHPVYARNPGSGEPLGKATTLVPAKQQVFHDPEHPSAITLPVMSHAIRARRGWRPGLLRR